MRLSTELYQSIFEFALTEAEIISPVVVEEMDKASMQDPRLQRGPIMSSNESLSLRWTLNNVPPIVQCKVRLIGSELPPG